MNAFKVGHMNPECCDQFPIPTALTASLAVVAVAAPPAAMQRYARRPPPHVSMPLEPAVYQRHIPHGMRRFAARIARHLARSPAHGDVSKAMSDEIRQPRRAQARRSVGFEYWR